MSEYKEQRRSSKTFRKRQDYLEHELSIMNPRRWRPNLPWRDYHFEFEDIIPALAGTDWQGGDGGCNRWRLGHRVRPR